ncbi:hypothetical protein TNIN_276261 [Trichonephila inaurata madagascariensis]|uniref:Uncharacterized protein n=1 Tax=Trichonephila inaurata madagascariensis TaxID=2747483 RepID=A0A8X6XNW8_9ARAC|nr:hypothetical protein TNIN_276261 [Trichonephila inaurata madagascariensis]
MKSGSYFLGLILLWALVAGKGRSESILFENEVDQDTSASGNSLTVAQPQAERRLSLEDFFLNRNSQQEQPAAQQLQAPDLQLQVQQPNPDSVVLVRGSNCASGGGGVPVASYLPPKGR